MQFLKKHYEKILLSVVLLGLVVAAAGLPFMVAQAREEINTRVNGVVKSKAKPWTVVNLSTNQEAVNHMTGPFTLELSGAHNLFNPVRWERTPAGLVKHDKEGRTGPAAVQIVDIRPLRLKVEFKMGEPLGDRARYTIVAEKETGAASPLKLDAGALLHQKASFFTIQKIEGDPKDPSALEVQLESDKLKMDKELPLVLRLERGKPSVHVVGHVADLAYPPQGQTFLNKKEGDSITLNRFGSDPYKIVVINESEVVLSPKSMKKTTIKKKN